jgi:hypothetical protein
MLIVSHIVSISTLPKDVRGIPDPAAVHLRANGVRVFGAHLTCRMLTDGCPERRGLVIEGQRNTSASGSVRIVSTA